MSGQPQHAMAPERVRLMHITTSPMSLTFLRGQVGYMQARGFDVHALSSPDASLDTFGAEYGVTTHAVDMPRRITPVRDLGAVRDIVRVLRTVRPHIVHGHTPKGGLLAMVAGRIARVPVRIYHLRGLPHLGATGWRRALLRNTERVSCSLAQRVIAVSESMRRIAVEDGLCPASKITVLAHGSGQGVDADRFDPERVAGARERTRDRLGIPRDAIVVGFVGRLVRDKGIVELARAWDTLRLGHTDVHLMLVGPFEPFDPVPSAVRHTLENDPRVHMTGADWDTPRLYAAMDVVALPSYREGFPNVPLEAAAMRLPVVATRVPGCSDAVEDGVTGVLVPARDAEALAAALRTYLVDPALRARHGNAGRERVLRWFRQEMLRAAIHDEYCRMLEHVGLPAPTGVAS